MDITEAEDYITGMNARNRESWEQTRLLMFFLSGIVGGKSQTVSEFMPFSWDKKDDTEAVTMTEEQRAALWDKAQQFEKILNNGI